jgi:protein-tyrosine-phosphatase
MSIEQSADLTRRAAIHAALGDPSRLAIIDRLLVGDASPSELQLVLAIPSNLIAHHIKVLESADVVRRTRSEGDGRRTYLGLNIEALDVMVPLTHQRATRVLFVCTHNSARSQLAVAIWNRHSGLPATSAGTHPVAEIHPGAVSAARRHDLQMHPRTPAHIDDVLSPGDLLVAVCDNAHEELGGDFPRIHWSIPDPARTSAPEAFDRTVDALTTRVDRLVPILQPIE